MTHYPTPADLKKIDYLVTLLELYKAYLEDHTRREKPSTSKTMVIKRVVMKKETLIAELSALLQTLSCVPLHAFLILY